jgi:cysteine-rich repeat protein
VTVGADYTACGGFGGTGPDVVFSIDVPDGDLLDATLSGQNFEAALILSSGCASLEGACFSYSEGIEDPLNESYHNISGSTQTVYIVIDSGRTGSSQQGMFDLAVALRTPTCGDGLLDLLELCDDGNIAAGDGCSSSCAVEGGSSCIGTPSICGNPQSGSSAPALAIPDNIPTGVGDSINITNACTILAVSIDINVSHTYIGDLFIELIAPDGVTTTRLHNRTGGDDMDIIGNYPATLTPAWDLDRFVGLSGQGDWTLTLSDNYNFDTGTLNSWSVNLICQ